MDARKWNRLSDAFDDCVFNIARTDLTGALERFVKTVPASPSSSVLVDLGCGTGSFIKKFGHRFHEILGVEFASRTIARAKKSLGKSAKIRWITMDVEKAAEIIGPRADLTTCLNVVTSPVPAKRKRLWASIAKATKPRGYALIVVPSLESELMVLEVSRKYGGDTGASKPTPSGIVRIDDARQKFFRRDELIADLAHHGLETVRIGRVFYPWSEEGLRKPRAVSRNPWGWICLARRVAA